MRDSTPFNGLPFRFANEQTRDSACSCDDRPRAAKTTQHAWSLSRSPADKLEIHLQGELNCSRSIRLAADLAEALTIVDIRGRARKHYSVEQVEELRSELNIELLAY